MQTLDIQFVGEIYDSSMSPDTCQNPGPCCATCPHFDVCDHHYDESDPVSND